MKKLIGVLLLVFMIVGTIKAQTGGSMENLPVKYEELTAPDFIKALKNSNGTCIIPFGILEKHGPHLPLGTDLLDARELSLRAAGEEYAIVFPQYYFGQIFEAKHQPGTIAYSSEVIWKLFQETLDELSRNGIKRIIIVNGHGGNNNFLKYFAQAQLEKKRDYAYYMFLPAEDPEFEAKVREKRQSEFDGHAGEEETSTMLTHSEEIVKLDQAGSQSGENLNRLKDLDNMFTGIWWYARYPNHYAGDGSPANKELGEMVIEHKKAKLVELIKKVKKDDRVFNLQDRFFEEAENPLETEQ